MSGLKVKILNSLQEVGREEWDALVADGSPFLEWDWLACLEESQCVLAKTGWQPQHLTVYDDDRLIAALLSQDSCRSPIYAGHRCTLSDRAGFRSKGLDSNLR